MTVRFREGVGAGFAGLCSCGSVWSDPVCNAKIMARRAVEIGGAVAVWQMAGKGAAFGTYTMRHHAGQSLGSLWPALSKAWHRVTAGAPWQRLVARFGIVGWIRVVEVTWGVNGWHVHTHVIFFLNDAAGVDVQEMHAAIFARWSAGLTDAGMAEPLPSGQDMHLLTGPADRSIADYFTKVDKPRSPGNVGLEMTHTQSKAARREHSTEPVWVMLDDIAAGDASALFRWHEWEQVSSGKRQISWSAGLRDLLGVMREQSDGQIAAEEVGSANDDLVFITAEGWDRLLTVPGLSTADVLTATESGGLAGLRSLLDTHGITYVPLGETNAA